MTGGGRRVRGHGLCQGKAVLPIPRMRTGVRRRERCDAGGRRLSSLQQTLLGGGHRVIRVAFQMRVRQWPLDASSFGPGAGGSPALAGRFIAPSSHRSEVDDPTFIRWVVNNLASNGEYSKATGQLGLESQRRGSEMSQNAGSEEAERHGTRFSALFLGILSTQSRIGPGCLATVSSNGISLGDRDRNLYSISEIL